MSISEYTSKFSLPRGDNSPTETRADPKTYGAIEGVEVFATWETIKELYKSAVHGKNQGGIYGTRKDGVFSVLLSDKYEDDFDKGDIIIYTGVGGKEKGTGVQTSDQSWDDRTENAAFRTSLHQENPVRVVRSSKCRSRYAPYKGFRYDGLYKVVECEMDLGENGKKVCHTSTWSASDSRVALGAPLGLAFKVMSFRDNYPALFAGDTGEESVRPQTRYIY